MMIRFAAMLALLATAAPAQIAEREGWAVHPTPHDFATLTERTRAAIASAPINIVTEASASDGAAMQGLTIPGNRVIGIYRNDYARRMLDASVPAGIEAPLRLYLTENDDGSATLSYKRPTAVFAPYADGGGLKTLAEELDGILAQIAEAAAN